MMADRLLVPRLCDLAEVWVTRADDLLETSFKPCEPEAGAAFLNTELRRLGFELLFEFVEFPLWEVLRSSRLTVILLDFSVLVGFTRRLSMLFCEVRLFSPFPFILVMDELDCNCEVLGREWDWFDPRLLGRPLGVGFFLSCIFPFTPTNKFFSCVSWLAPLEGASGLAPAIAVLFASADVIRVSLGFFFTKGALDPLSRSPPSKELMTREEDDFERFWSSVLMLI